MMAEHRIAIGGHLSTSDGFCAMGEVAHAMDATTFAFFTRNPRGGTAKAIDPDDARALQAFMATLTRQYATFWTEILHTTRTRCAIIITNTRAETAVTATVQSTKTQLDCYERTD